MDVNGRALLSNELCDGIRQKFMRFLSEYSEETDPSQVPGASQESDVPMPERRLIYMEQLQMLEDVDHSVLTVNFSHLNEWDAELAEVIVEQYYRLDPFLRKGLQNLVALSFPSALENAEGLQREFWVSFTNLPTAKRLRDLKSGCLGKLVCFVGTVTRTSEVRPELFLASFRCLECSTVVKGVEQHFKYSPPLMCPNPKCGNRIHWQLVREDSTFIDWQRAKVQENSDEVPAGSLPRTMEVILRNEIVETARPGDKAVFTGVLVVVPDVAAISAPGERVEARSGRNQGANAGEGVSGPRFLGSRELTYRLSFIACSIQEAEVRLGQVNIRGDTELSPDDVLANFTDAEVLDIEGMAQNPRIYTDMARSIAPGVYGHEDVKKAVLLMLLGGVHKKTAEGINLRGDINVAIVGDPSCAKSQMLKYVSSFLPRAVYTSGKSSSAAGLTASVVKESDTNEFCIEAGALMLADNGICCIDEFDKMDVKDQVAIHEAMEQQTISIAKAGIQATLNARTSILAAANPVGGRYDKSKPLRYNVALPPAILSRFDLMHIMIDEPDDMVDRQVAQHIVAVHQRRDRAFNVPYTMKQMQCYIKYCRSHKPQMSEEARTRLVAAYKRLRTEDAVPGSSTAYRITVRQLEALIRLSEALARLHCQVIIQPAHVKEAQRLVKNSILAIEAPEENVDDDDWVADAEEVEQVVERARRADGEDPGPGDRSGGADGLGGRTGDDGDEDEGGGEGGSGGGGRQRTSEVAASTDEAGRSAGHDEGDDGPGSQTAEQLEEKRRIAAAALKERAEAGQPKQATRVSQKKVDLVKETLVRKLREMEDVGEASNTMNDVAVAALPQHDLITAYFDQMAERQALPPTEELKAEVVLVSKIVQHLITKQAVLLVVDTPARLPEDDDMTYARRVQKERLLAVNPNYTMDT